MNKKSLKETFNEIFTKDILNSMSVEDISALISRALIDCEKLQSISDDALKDVEDLKSVLLILNSKLNGKVI